MTSFLKVNYENFTTNMELIVLNLMYSSALYISICNKLMKNVHLLKLVDIYVYLNQDLKPLYDIEL